LGFGLNDEAFTFSRLLAVVGEAGVEGIAAAEVDTVNWVDPFGPLALLLLELED
jgi:hypothetical protein